jgi:tyrosyl-tRNA synthetase
MTLLGTDTTGLAYSWGCPLMLFRKRVHIDRMMTDRRLGAYVGIDPTAPSLHVGHMIPFMSLFWMFVNGYHTVSLLGGATAKIGDPTGRLTTRDKEHSSVGTANMANMHIQLKKVWINVETYGKKYGYNWEWSWHRELINNNAWWNSLPMLDVLKILGPGMRLGSMLARDT